jgi:nucleoside-diphosphate-sugar epimerase
MKKVLEEDFESVYQGPIDWNTLHGKTVLVTGTTGLIGSLIIHYLWLLKIKYSVDVNIIANARCEEKAKVLFKDMDMQYVIGDVREPLKVEGPIDYIIHCAANTKSRDMVTNPVENIQTSIYGTDNICRLAKEKGVKSMVYLSSMEVYGVLNYNMGSVLESDLGYIDLAQVRSCYPEGKRMAELLCNCYEKQYNVPIKIARLAQTFGAGIGREENRVFAQFAKSVIKSENIVLHTDGSSVGNYCYTADSIKAVFIILLKGQNGETYNVANEDTNMTIFQMAELVAKDIANKKISVEFDIPENADKYGYAPRTNIKLCSDKLRKLGWVPNYGMHDMYKRMIEWLK